MWPRPGIRAARPAAIQRLLRGPTTDAWTAAPQVLQMASRLSRRVPQRPQITLETITSSFTKGASLATMDLTYTPEEEAFRAEVRAWLQANLPADWGHGGVGGYREEADEEIQRVWQRRLYEAGWLTLAWPQDQGGRGASPVVQAIYQEELVLAGGPPPSRGRGPAPAGAFFSAV